MKLWFSLVFVMIGVILVFYTILHACFRLLILVTNMQEMIIFAIGIGIMLIGYWLLGLLEKD